MKHLIIAAALLGASAGALAQANVHIDIGQPGFYGSIDLGDGYRPRVVYDRPVIISRPAQYIAEPLYLRVPPGHRNNWRKHCYRYNACGREVFFVRDDWYQNEYAPRYREVHHLPAERAYVVRQPATRVVERVVEVDRRDYRDEREHGRGHDRHEDRGHGDEHGHDDDHGHGHGHGHDRD